MKNIYLQSAPTTEHKKLQSFTDTLKYQIAQIHNLCPQREITKKFIPQRPENPQQVFH